MEMDTGKLGDVYENRSCIGYRDFPYDYLHRSFHKSAFVVADAGTVKKRSEIKYTIYNI